MAPAQNQDVGRPDYVHRMELGTEAIGHVVARLLDKPNARADHDRVIPTGLRLLDEILAGGLRTGQTTVVAGRSGEGASTFALGMARSAALRHRLPTAVLAPDAPEAELVTRLISAETFIRAHQLRSRELTESDEERLREKEERLTAAPLAIWAGRQFAGNLVDSVNAMTFEDDDVRLVVADGIATLGDDAREAVAVMTRLARERHFALVLVSGVVERSHDETRLTLAHLRDHDAVADLVDTVLMLEQDEAGQVHVHVVKHRFGPTGSFDVGHLQDYCAFVDLPEGT